uniref:Elongator complex protein 6 n=1 Tax=Petromyzon marinus TaxID=7757 RepID=S4RUY2_PETMA
RRAEMHLNLGTTPKGSWEGSFVLLTEDQTDGGFLIHHFLSSYVKDGWKVCFIAMAQSFHHYATVAQKLGVNLGLARRDGQLVVLEGLTALRDLALDRVGERAEPAFPCSVLRNGYSESLRDLYTSVKHCLLSSEPGSPVQRPVLIVDSVNSLSTLGFSVPATLAFLHYCRVLLNHTLHGDVVVLLSADSDVDDADGVTLHRSVAHQAHTELCAQALPSGAARDVDGLLTVWTRFPDQALPHASTRGRYRYKLHDRRLTLSPALD